MKRMNKFFPGVLLGALLAYLILHYSSWMANPSHTNQSENTVRKPLYWVAPMDSSFRQDQPGFSPMGMALVPVYDQPGDEPGMVKISPKVSQSLGVKTFSVRKIQLTQEIQTVGYIQYNENLLAHVHPRVSGWVNQLFVKSDGLMVKQGDPLFSLYSPELINAQEEYLLALSRQQSSLINAAEARLQSLQINKQTIQEIKRSRKAQQNITFFAPQSGVISHLNVREGFYLQPGNELMTLADLSSVWLDIELTEQQLAWVNKGDQVSMKSEAIPGKSFSGTVEFVYPFLDEISKTGKVRLAFENPQFILKPNMIADILIKPQHSVESVVVPRSAVIRTGDQNRVVWAQSEGQYKSVAVELGQANGDYFAITSGLSIGDEVVISAHFLIDSESNKTSDFDRYSNQANSGSEKTVPTMIQSARTKGTINSIENAVWNISREAVEKWGRPAATLNFTPEPELLKLNNKWAVNDTIEFTFEIRGSEFVITEIHQKLMEHKRD
ncbi:MAG: efflux RND transporter periplasmic adaptor subunit [Marinicella sp.]